MSGVETVIDAAERFDPWALVEVERESQMVLTPAEFDPPGYGAAASSIPAIWLRQINEGETPRQHAAFNHYCALGPERTLKWTSEELGVGYGTIQKWSSEFDWSDRSLAWDNYRSEQYELTLLEDLKSMARRHAETMVEGIEALASAFSPILADQEGFQAELNGLPAREKMRLAVAAAKVMPGLMNAERMARGLPMELSNDDSNTAIEIRASSLDDLKVILGGLADTGLEHKSAGVVDARKVEDDDK